MLIAFLAVIVGVTLLVWSADRFVKGAVSTARYYKVPTLLIGSLVIGFGTSAPEMIISALAAVQGNPGVSLGNAYGSNVANIGLILGLSAILQPIRVHSQVLRKELPVLIAVTGLAAMQVWDGRISRSEAAGLLALFVVLMGGNIWQGLRKQNNASGSMTAEEFQPTTIPIFRSVVWLVLGLLLLVGSSRILVWGAVIVAREYGVSDLVIGLTIVAIGTSLPELASSIIAARKGEHDLAVGNVLGSNLFNTLAVVGLAGVIHPMSIGNEVLSRDLLLVGVLTVALFVFSYGFRGPARINRWKGAFLFAFYLGYNLYLAAYMLSKKGGH